MGERKNRSDKHPGVILFARKVKNPETGKQEFHSWRAKWIDPDKQAWKYETLPEDDAKTAEKRRAWAIRKADEVRDRKRVLAGGAARKKNVTLADAIERYYLDVSSGLRASTLGYYRTATDTMLEWAGKNGITLADELKGEHLAGLKSWLVNKPGMKQAEGGRVETGKARGLYAANRDIRGIKAVLEHLRLRGLVPLITHDMIRDNLKTRRPPKPLPVCLEPATLRRILEACERHDRKTWKLSREEKARGLTEGNTPRYEPVSPFLVFLLLTGMRESEARLLRWDQIDLEARPMGLIHLKAEGVKTHADRDVSLKVSPALVAWLRAEKLKAGESVHVFGDAEAESDDQDDQDAGDARPRLTRALIEAARRRLIKEHGSPRFAWKDLRSTCASYLANAFGIAGDSSLFFEARQLGHSHAVSERHYAKRVEVPQDATALEDAMEIAKEIRSALGIPVSASAKNTTTNG